MEEGKCIIIAAPSGAGKTTIVHHLLNLDLGLEFSISVCSREKRRNEIDEKDYYFITVEEFQAKIDAGDFIEWEEVYPAQYYGTLRSEIDRIWRKGNTVIFDVDVAGALRLKKIFGEQTLAVFVMVPSMEELEKRLVIRGTETLDKIAERLGKAEDELKNAGEFDKVVVNDNLPHALKDTEQLVRDFLNPPE